MGDAFPTDAWRMLALDSRGAEVPPQVLLLRLLLRISIVVVITILTPFGHDGRGVPY